MKFKITVTVFFSNSMNHNKNNKWFINRDTFTYSSLHTEVRFASFLSGGFIITAIVVNPPERKLAKLISLHYHGSGTVEA